METQADFNALLELLNGNGVEYLIVGAHALAFHGVPRSSGDLDVYLRPTESNAALVLRALSEFGFASLQITAEDLCDPDTVIQLGYPPLRIDLITGLSGVTWEEAALGRASGTFNEIPVHYLGRAELVKNKRATGRTRDLADLEALGEA